MQKSLKAINDRYVAEHYEALLAAAARARKTDTADLDHNESLTAKFLAATQLNCIEEALESSRVVKSLKRAALVQVGCFLYHFNRYGVSCCTVPGEAIGSLTFYVWGPVLPYDLKDRLILKFGFSHKWNGREDIFDYTAYQEVPA
jgi:hypothetical protein